LFVLFQYIYAANYTEQSPALKGNICSAGQEIIHHLWKSRVHYRVHNPTPLNRILNPHKFSPLQIYFSTYSPIHVYISLVAPSLQIFLPKFCTYFSLPSCWLCSFCLIVPWFDYLNNMCGRVKIIKLFIFQFSAGSC